MRKAIILAAALTALSAPALASPPPARLPDQTVHGFKFTYMYLFPFHTWLQCQISDPNHVGGRIRTILDYYATPTATHPFAHWGLKVRVPANGSVSCPFGHLPGGSYTLDHFTLGVTARGTTDTVTVPLN
jgi:hypothetical protein